ncbi:MAG: L-histidine N(alpha)-methyltransferase [Acidimicrobiia bacterium]
MSLSAESGFVIDYLTEPRDHRAQMMEDVRRGLTAEKKSLPSKYFYDALGSKLFEEITLLPEYYLTRAETEILAERSDELMRDVAPEEMVELGSGSSKKTVLLLEAMHRAGGHRYVPIDVSPETLRSAAAKLKTRFPWLEIEGLVGDYREGLDRIPRRGRRLIAFLGATIGNYEGEQRSSLLSSVGRALGPDDRFLVGIDLVKEEKLMVAAYNDSAGVSEQFNKNILRVINRELGGNFPLDAFEHVSRWVPAKSCMSQSLRANRDLVVHIDALDLVVTLRRGEEIHTEVSCKFTREGFGRDLALAGLQIERWVTDAGGQFALVLAGPAG